MSKCTEAEVEQIMADPKYKAHTAIRVYEDGDDVTATWNGREVRAAGGFGLDSRLDEVGCPRPRNLFLMEVVSDV